MHRFSIAYKAGYISTEMYTELLSGGRIAMPQELAYQIEEAATLPEGMEELKENMQAMARRSLSYLEALQANFGLVDDDFTPVVAAMIRSEVSLDQTPLQIQSGMDLVLETWWPGPTVYKQPSDLPDEEAHT